MSQNQSRVEKKEKQYRKTGGVKPHKSSSDQLHRSFSATGSGASPAPPLPSNSRSFKKSDNAQGGQSKGTLGSVNTASSKSNPTDASVLPVENGNNLQTALHAPKSSDTSSQKSSQSKPKAPSQSSSMTSESTLPSTPKGEAGKGYPLQFGSISPGTMKVPARTSSAPPYLDDQTSDQVMQVQHAAVKPAQITPAPPPSKQLVPEKNVPSEQPIAQESPIVTKGTRDVQVTSTPPPLQPMHTQKPAVLPMAGMSMPMPYHQHQPPVPMQFGGPNPHIQAQGTPNNSFHMQMPLHVGSPPQLPQQVFMHGFQHHPLQNQGIIHQGQNFGFNPQLGTPPPQQSGNIGATMSPQFNLQQPGNNGVGRKTVRITHPETHEELRLDNRDGGSPGSRSQHIGPPPSKPMPFYTAMRPSGYYSNTYTSGPPMFPVPNALPLKSNQSTASSQAPRFNYPINQVPPNMLFMNQSASNTFNGKGATSAQSSSPLMTVNSATVKGIESNAIGKVESQKLVGSNLDRGVLRKGMEANADDSSLQLKSGSDCLQKPLVNSLTNMDVVRDVQKQPGKKDHSQSLPLVGAQADSSVLQDHGNTLEVAAHRLVETESSGKDQCSTQKDHILQATEQEGEKEGVGMKLGSALKDTSLVKRIEQCDKPKKIDHEVVEFEASQRDSEPATSKTEGDRAVLETCPPDDVSKCMSDNEAALASVNISDRNIRQEVEPVERERPTSSGFVSGSSKIKNNKGKKKRKEMLQKADALGTTTDLYMAYKGSEEKKETVVAGVGTSGANFKVLSDDGMDNGQRKKMGEQSKPELEDWEDVADVSAPKLESTLKEEGRGSHYDGKEAFAKKYSRDFLLTLSGQCTDLPENFQVMPDIAQVFLRFNANASRSDHEYASSGRNTDKASRAPQHDRRVNGMVDVNRRKTGSHLSGRDAGIDLAYSSNMMGFQSVPGPNYGGFRNPHGQGPIQHAGGILSGPMGFPVTHRNNPEMERWQRATNFNKGLMPTPSQVMHRAENKYEVGKVSDEEQAKQRRLKAILNKLTPQNFEKLFEQVKEVEIDNVVTLTGVISQIFDKALTEPTFCEMYANFCYYLASELPDLSVDNEKITFKRLLLNKCQEEFERGEREEEEANKADSDGEIKQTEEEREGKRLKARRRMLGNIRLIGELYKKKMLTERIMHECIKKLLGQYQNPDEENIEALCKLLSTIGEMIDHPKAKEHMDAYYDIMGQLSINEKLSSRVKFMLKDAIDLRKNKWQQRMKVEGPKKIEEVHRDAAQERFGQGAGRVSHGPNMKTATKRGQPLDYGSRNPILHPPGGHLGGSRGAQFRGFGGQDPRMDDRSTFESRNLSVPLPQRSFDEPITLGPQGGLARGMACRGTTSVSNSPSTDATFNGDYRRMMSGSSNFSDPYSPRGNHFRKQSSDRFGTPVSYDRYDGHDLNYVYTNRDVKNSDRGMAESDLASSNVTRSAVILSESIASEKVWPEKHLKDKSLETIKEYYSIKDEKEVVLCIKDLNATKFYPTVISVWVTDAFERKDNEQDLLTKLLISLTKSQGGMFNPQQLIEGFESVLYNFEDTVTDAPKAPEFLGRIFGKLILENVLPLNEVGRLIHKGGEEPGSLLETGLAADVLGSTLETIKSEKGESKLKEIQTSSSLRLEDFRPPNPLKSKKLEMFII